MNHKLHYEKLIEHAKQRCWTRNTAPVYVESHHIIPRSVGGKRLRNNQVLLTAKEHYIAHLLLTKMYNDDPIKKKSMVAAYLHMAGIAVHTPGGKIRDKSRLYESFRKEHAIMNSGPNNHMWGRKQSDKQKEAVRKANLGKIVSDETREKMRIASTGRKHTEETKETIRQKHLGKILTEEHKQKIGESLIGHKQPESQKQKVAEKLSQNWIVTHPDGREEEIFNLRAFCREHSISDGNLVNYGHTKGYKARKKA